MFESLDGLLTPTTRQKDGSSLSIVGWRPPGTDIVPPVIGVAEVIVVLPSNVSLVRSAQLLREPAFAATARACPESGTATAATIATTSAVMLRSAMFL